MTYNILADLYADTEANMHSQCPKDALALDYRKQLWIKEILG